ncbi:MAG: radical SAM protein [Nitrososphaeria archaeon]
MIDDLIERTEKGDAKAAEELLNINYNEVFELFEASSSLRDKKKGRRIRIVGHQGDVSPCSLNPPCRFCSLSSSLGAYKSERIAVPMDTIIKNSIIMVNRGARALLYGGGISPISGKIAVDIAEAIKRVTDIEVYFNVGPVLENDVNTLKRLGVRRFVISLETLDRKSFQDARPGDSYDKKIEFIKLLGEKGMGISVILMNGVGGSLIRSITSLMEFKGISGIRFSTFKPVPGTPWEKREPASVFETLKSCAVARLLFNSIELDLAAGVSDDLRSLSFMAGCGNEVIGMIGGRDGVRDWTHRIRADAKIMGFSVE